MSTAETCNHCNHDQCCWCGQPTKKVMDTYTATGIAEGFIKAESEEQVIEAWQHLHTTGVAYQLQGFFGRQAQAMLEAGIIT